MKPLIIVFIISALYLSYQLIRSRRPKHWLIVSSSLSLAVIVSFQFLGGVFLIPTESMWIGPYISIHFLSLNPLLVRRRR
ncbi:hypothetical protein L2W99_26790, partial [Citrobacter freundii]|nr:hypothetical protein [Citrobacter freundii]